MLDFQFVLVCGFISKFRETSAETCSFGSYQFVNIAPSSQHIWEVVNSTN